MIRINRIVESAILSALDLEPRNVKPCGVRHMMDNGCPMFLLFYDGVVPVSDKYHMMSTIDGNKAIAVTVDIVSSTWENDKYYLNYED